MLSNMPSSFRARFSDVWFIANTWQLEDPGSERQRANHKVPVQFSGLRLALAYVSAQASLARIDPCHASDVARTTDPPRSVWMRARSHETANTQTDDGAVRRESCG